MKVSASKIENTQLSRGMKKVSPTMTKPTFGAGLNNIAPSMTTIKKDFPLIPKILFWISKHKGEITNNIVIAAGTAFVAPIFIAFNPFSKEDKETKIYSAWRQPLSAIISLAAAIGCNMKFNRYSEEAASIGKLGNINLTSCPTDSYLKTLIKKETPGISKKELDDKVASRKMDIFKEHVEKARKTMADAEIPKEALIGRESFDEALEKVEKDYENKLKTMSRTDAKKFKHEKAMEIAYEKIEQSLKDEAQKKLIIRQYHQKGKTVDEAIELAKLTWANADEKTTKKSLYKSVLDQLESIKEYEAHHNKKPFESLKNLGSNYDEIYKNVKIKQVVSAAAENARFSLGKWKSMGGIVISLLTLPFACGILNWSYPRIMEKIMPEVANKKKASIQKQNQTNQGKEVKA